MSKGIKKYFKYVKYVDGSKNTQLKNVMYDIIKLNSKFVDWKI